MKLLKQKILYTLALHKDFFHQQRFEIKPYQYLYTYLDAYKHSSIRDACLQLVDTGELDKVRKRGKSYFRLTSLGRSQLASFMPQMKVFNKNWDILWRVAILTSSRGKKAGKKPRMRIIKLRKKMHYLGFRKLSRGVYLCPFAVGDELRQYILANKLAKSIFLFETNKLLVGDSSIFGHHLWGLDKLYEQYAKFITQANGLLASCKRKKPLTNQAKNTYYALVDAFFYLLKSDPGLPRKLLGFRWPLTAAKSAFFKLSKRFDQHV